MLHHKKSHHRNSRSIQSFTPSMVETLENRTLLSADLVDAAIFADATPRAIAKPAISIVASDSAAAERRLNPGRFTISRTGSTARPLTVFYSIHGSARNGYDYKRITTSITIPAGRSSAALSIVPIDDRRIERTEAVSLALSTNTAYSLAAARVATVNIADNDGPVVQVSNAGFAAADVEAASRAGIFTFTRTGSTARALRVYYTIGGSATRGTDYQNLPGSVLIEAGKASAAVKVVPIDDLSPENNETVQVTLADGLYQRGRSRTSTVTILDDDTAQQGVSFITFVGPRFGADNQANLFRVSSEQGGIAPTNISASMTALGVAGNDYNVNTSPDGQWLVLQTTRFGGDAGGTLAVVPANNLTAGEQIVISGNKIAPADPVFAVASGGDLVIYASADGPHQLDLWAARRASGVWSTTLITNDSPFAYNYQPAISADGSKVLFTVGDEAGNGDAIAEVNTDATGFHVIVDQTDGPALSSATANLNHPDYYTNGDIIFAADWVDAKSQIWRSTSGSVVSAFSDAVNEFTPTVLSDGRIATLWSDRPGNDAHVLELTLRYATGGWQGTILAGIDLPATGLGASA